MISSYIKIIIRSLFRDKLFTLINVLGLAVALAVVLVISAYIHHELSYEDMHSKAERTYRVTIRYKNANGYDTHWARVNSDWVNNLENDFEEVEKLIRFQNYDPRSIKVGEEKFKIEHAFSVDHDVFEVFDFQLLQGNPATALKDPHSVVLTEGSAYRFFGDKNPIGEEITILNNFNQQLESYVVTGIMKDLPENTHLPVNLLTSFKNEEERTGWAYTYILLRDTPQAVVNLEKQIKDFKAKYGSDNSNVSLQLQPVSSIHLHSALAREIIPNGNVFNLMLFGGVGLFIFFMATINFINLNTAQSLKKLREIGVRRVLGSAENHLSLYFLLRSNIIAFLAVAIAFLFVLIFRREFETLINTEVPVILLLIIGFCFAVITGISAGYFPAFVLAKVHPIKALKSGGNIKQGPLDIKKGLVAFQLITCIVLLTSALITRSQFEFISGKKLNLQEDQVIAIKDVPASVKENYLVFKDKISSMAQVEGVTASMEVPSREIRDMGVIFAEGIHEDPQTAPVADIQVVDENFIPLMEMEVIAGRNFLPRTQHTPYLEASKDYVNYLTNHDQEYIINETALKSIGWTSPEEAIGKTFSWSIGELNLKRGKIVGVIKDYHQETLRNKIDPLVMVNEPIWFNNVLIRLNYADMKSSLTQIENTWNELFPDHPMEYSFIDDLYNNLYQKEQQQLSLIYVFTSLAVVIAFLGIFGLITYTLQTRIKEIAIRKVLGATLTSITYLLSKDFLKITALGIIVAIPITWYIMDLWLQNYAYRIDLGPVVFATAILTVLGVFMLSILLQIIKADKENPADTLRVE